MIFIDFKIFWNGRHCKFSLSISSSLLKSIFKIWLSVFNKMSPKICVDSCEEANLAHFNDLYSSPYIHMRYCTQLFNLYEPVFFLCGVYCKFLLIAFGISSSDRVISIVDEFLEMKSDFFTKLFHQQQWGFIFSHSVSLNCFTTFSLFN